MTSSLLLIPTSTESATTAQISVASSGIMLSTPTNTNDFTIKATHVNLCNVIPGTPSYIYGWSKLMTTMGVNTLRIEDGGEARYGYRVGIDTNWDTNLMTILDTINPDRTGASGFKVYWQYLGDPWDLEFGINDAYRVPNDGSTDGTGSGGTGLLNINTVKSMIDKLAGDNSLRYDFINDPRIVAWAVGNECKVGTSSGGVVTTNTVYDWLIQIMDHIRSKGAKVIANALYVDDWNMNFALTAPLFYGHANYMETHEYRVQELAKNFYYGNLQFNWEGWKTYVQGILSAQVTAAANAGFDSDHVVLGEFGIFPAHNPDWNTGIYWTQQTQKDYYTYYFQALNAVGSIKWTSPFCAFMSGAYYYGFIAAPSGTTYPAYNIVAEYYA